MNRFLALQKIVETGSFSKAAAEIHCTQSAISQMIASLEDEFSLKLLTRSRSGAGLTREGEQLYPLIERAIIAFKSVQIKADEVRGLDIGEIRIGTISSISSHWLPRIIKIFKDLHPAIDFIIRQGDYISIAEWIKTGAVDFGFLSPSSARSAGLKSFFVKKGEMMAILPQNHPLASLEVVPLKDLCKESYILLEEGNVYEPLNVFRSIGLKPDIKYILHDDYSILNMIEEGLGVSILAKLVMMKLNYKVVSRPTDPPVTRDLVIAYRDKNSMPTAAKRFIELFKKHIDTLP